MNLYVWFFLLILQNAAFTWVSRARNSGSLMYHAAASITSNGVFFVSNFIMIDTVTSPNMNFETGVRLGFIYVAGTVTGSLLMHWVSMRYLESGKRKVGAS